MIKLPLQIIVLFVHCSLLQWTQLTRFRAEKENVERRYGAQTRKWKNLYYNLYKEKAIVDKENNILKWQLYHLKKQFLSALKRLNESSTDGDNEWDTQTLTGGSSRLVHRRWERLVMRRNHDLHSTPLFQARLSRSGGKLVPPGGHLALVLKT